MGAQGDAVALRDRKDQREAGDRGGTLVDAARGDLLGRLSSGLVHEARNPLNAMAIHLEVLADKLRDEATGEIPPNLARNLDAARGQVRRLDELLRVYGEFAGGHVGSDDLPACLERSAALAAYHLRRAGLEIAVEAERGLPLPAPERVGQAVLQLLLVACDRGASGAQVTLRGTRRERGIRIVVDGPAQEEVEGGGEGRAVEAARAIVSALGGEITLEHGRRWTCTIDLPPRPATPRVVT